MNLNADLYKRFGLELELEKVQDGFSKYVKNSILEELAPLAFPDKYQEVNELDTIQRSVVSEAYRQMFIDYKYFDYLRGFENFIESLFTGDDIDFEEYLLNLQILLNIVSIHSLVKSELDKGTIFTLYFPATRKEITGDRQPKELIRYTGSGESILVVDDIRDQREIASKILSQLGYSVKTVSSGEEAIEYLSKETVDLIVLDMIMSPGIDGLETYSQIITRHPGQKTIIASGFSETNRVKEAQKLGAGKYVKKPYTIENIGLAIKAELDKEKKAA